MRIINMGVTRQDTPIHYGVDVAGTVLDEDGTQLLFGDLIHIDKKLPGDPAARLPPRFVHMKKAWSDKTTASTDFIDALEVIAKQVISNG